MRTFVLALALTLSACTQIDTGNVGVESTFGQVKDQSLPPGIYFTLFKTVHEIAAKEIPVELQNMNPKTMDNVTLADLDVSIYYRIAAEQAAKVFIKYAGDLEWSKSVEAFILGQGIVTRLAREAAYRAVAKHHSSDAHTKRVEIAHDVRDYLQKELESDVGKGTFVITNVVVRNLVTDARLEQSIKEAAQVEFQIRQKKQQIELAKAEAERLRIEAEGAAKANEIIAKSLTASLIEMRRIEMTGQFAQKGTHTVLMGGNGIVPLVPLK